MYCVAIGTSQRTLSDTTLWLSSRAALQSRGIDACIAALPAPPRAVFIRAHAVVPPRAAIVARSVSRDVYVHAMALRCYFRKANRMHVRTT